MPTPTEKRAYARKLIQIERRFGHLERDTLRRSIELLRDFRNRVAGQLSDIDNFEQFRLRELQGNLNELITQYEGQLRALNNGAIRGSFNLGRSFVVEPLESAGITNIFFRPSPAQINVLLDFTADLITGIGHDIRKRINTQISMAALGERSPFQAMKEITKIIGLPAKASDPVKGISYQAERILRTEVNRAYNLAIFSQQRDLAEQVPDLKKQWRATGDERTRDSHLVAHGRIVLVNEPFIVGGAKLMYPLDPAGPAEETINCRCRSITVIPEIGPIPSPLDDKIEAEWARRGEEEDRKRAEKERKAIKLKIKKAKLAKAERLRRDEKPAPLLVPQNLDTMTPAMERIEEDYRADEIEDSLRLTKRLADEGDVCIRVPEGVFEEILHDGYFMNQHESGESGGMLDNDMREGAEMRMFGIPRGSSADTYPIYGYMRGDGYTEGNLAMYGRVRITLKKRIKDAITITYGDSLNFGHYGTLVPSPLNNPHAGNIAQGGLDFWEVDRHEKLGEALNEMGAHYVEAQIHGGIMIDDIERIDFALIDPHQEILTMLLEDWGFSEDQIGVFNPLEGE